MAHLQKNFINFFLVSRILSYNAPFTSFNHVRSFSYKKYNKNVRHPKSIDDDGDNDYQVTTKRICDNLNDDNNHRDDNQNNSDNSKYLMNEHNDTPVLKVSAFDIGMSTEKDAKSEADQEIIAGKYTGQSYKLRDKVHIFIFITVHLYLYMYLFSFFFHSPT